MYSKRRERLPWASAAIDALLVSALPNIRYLTGFTGSNALLLARPGEAILFTDPRYATQAAAETDLPVRISRNSPGAALLTATLRRWKPKRLGFERSRIPWALWAAISEGLPLGTAFVPVDQVVETLRMVKEAAELDAIRRSVAVTAAAFEGALKRFQFGATELDLAAEIDYQMRRLGASQPAFDTIVASGPRAALPHARPTSQKILKNQLLLIDMGATVDGYASDMTRMAAVGSVPPGWKRRFQATLEAQAAAVAAVRPGIAVRTVDRYARKVLKERGLHREFLHSTGHGLGLEIHEPPRLAPREKTLLAPGMVVTIEPGIYQPGQAGIRIEDTVLVTEGGVEVLTTVSKELWVIA